MGHKQQDAAPQRLSGALLFAASAAALCFTTPATNSTANSTGSYCTPLFLAATSAACSSTAVAPARCLLKLLTSKNHLNNTAASTQLAETGFPLLQTCVFQPLELHCASLHLRQTPPAAASLSSVLPLLLPAHALLLAAHQNC